VQPRAERLAARKLWIAFAQAAEGRVVVDEGARRALVESGRSLLPAGIRAVEGTFDEAAAVEVVGPDGAVFAKGLVRMSGAELRQAMGKRSSELPEDLRREAIHRDDLVVLP
jgi:glutamate 5-kinase